MRVFLRCFMAKVDVLSDVVRAVAGRCEVYLDGGIRTGTDVFKALALGATAVFVGRPVIYGLVYNVRICYRKAQQLNRYQIIKKNCIKACERDQICCQLILLIKHYNIISWYYIPYV